MKPKMCYITYTLNERRTLDELGFLKEYFDVFPVEIQKGLLHSFFKIFRIVPRCDLVYSWYSNKPAALAVFLSKVLSKDSFCCVQGHEPANVLEYGYGSWRRWIDRVFVRFVFRNATKILPVSKFSYDEVKNRVNNGFNLFLLYAGVDIDDFAEPDYSMKQDDFVVMVCGVKWSNVWRKGLETFVRLGYYLPDYRFMVIGKIIDDSIVYLKRIASDNVIFTGYVSNDVFKSLLERAKIVCMFSYYEAFGSGLAEAMCKGCIPIVTNGFNDFRNIVGDTGFFVDYNDLSGIVDAVKKIECFDVDDMRRCRNRIINLFSMELRKKQLLKVLT